MHIEVDTIILGWLGHFDGTERKLKVELDDASNLLIVGKYAIGLTGAEVRFFSP